jgi:hypothetical protein
VTRPLVVSEPFQTAPVRARSVRRGYEIHAYVGSNGGGKSMAAVYDSLPSLAMGRPIVSTVRILDPATGEPHPLWVPLDDFRVLLEVERADVIMDEVTGVASSRESAGMPAAVANHLMQLRRRDVSLRWTAPNWKRADTLIREVSRGITTCVGFAPEPAPKVDGQDRLWRSRRGFMWRTYDAKNFDEWSTAKERSSSKSHRIKPAARQMVWCPGLIARSAYDTFDAVLTLGAVSDAGLCMDCGGKRRAKSCSCKDDSPVRDPSAGMLLWRERWSHLRAVGPSEDLAVPVLLPETDETPAVLGAAAS